MHGQHTLTELVPTACRLALFQHCNKRHYCNKRVPLVVNPSKAVNPVGVECRRMGAMRKNAAMIVDEINLKQAVDGPYRERRLKAIRDELA